MPLNLFLWNSQQRGHLFLISPSGGTVQLDSPTGGKLLNVVLTFQHRDVYSVSLWLLYLIFKAPEKRCVWNVSHHYLNFIQRSEQEICCEKWMPQNSRERMSLPQTYCMTLSFWLFDLILHIISSMSENLMLMITDARQQNFFIWTQPLPSPLCWTSSVGCVSLFSLTEQKPVKKTDKVIK